MSQYFPPYRSSGGNIKVGLYLSNYATITDLKNVTHVDFSSFASKTNLASLKTEVDKLDIAKLTPVPHDLIILSNVVKSDVVKKTEYNKLMTKLDNIDTRGFVLKSKYDKDKSDIEKKIPNTNNFVKITEMTKLTKKIAKAGGLVVTKPELVDVENKIPDVSGLVKKTDYNSKITEIESKISSITGLATNSVLTAVENKISNASSLVKKTDYNTKISEIESKVNNHNHDKYITTPEFNNLAAGVFTANLAQGSLVTKTDLDTKLQDISERINSNKSKARSNNNETSSSESKGLSNEKLSSTKTSNYNQSLRLVYNNKLKFGRDLLK